jgi:hypothetical protein
MITRIPHLLRTRADLLAILLLVALCWLFHWRLLAADVANQQSFVEGDFSGQFVAFAQYQAERFAQGEVPLWNPYNLGGHPFLADTQAAVFYPPRLVTIGLLNATGGSTPGRMYDALQKEVIAHTLIASLLMYAFVRRLTREGRVSVAAALASAIIFAYGGYLTGYPQLQVAVIEAGVWLPLALLGVHMATEERPHPQRAQGVLAYGLAGIALGLSLLAGHPQTTLFFLYTALLYLGWRVVTARQSWWWFALGAAIFVGVGGGLAAVQVVPGLEYLSLTTRGDLTFEAKGNGFPIHDLMQVVAPGLVSLWSPLFIGVSGLLLVILAFRGQPQARREIVFWGGLGLVALLISFGRGTVVYDLVYLVVPGFSLFRGQERSAYVVAVCAAVLAGYGLRAALSSPGAEADEAGESARPAGARSSASVPLLLVYATGSLFIVVFLHWLVTPGTEARRVSVLAFSTLVACGAAWLLGSASGTWRALAFVALIAFELFSVGRASPNLESRPASTRLAPGFGVAEVRAGIETTHRTLIRVDTLRENFGTLYGLFDVQGISPLKLASVERVLKLPRPRLWEVMAVRYVITPDSALPAPTQILAQIDDPYNPFKLHMLTQVRPFARVVSRTWVEPDPNAAAGLMSDPAFDSQGTVMLDRDPGLALTADSLTGSGADLAWFSPEYVRLDVTTGAAALLNIALVNYPGWEATLDGSPAPILTADLAMMAIPIPQPGAHRVELRFRPPSVGIGAAVTLATLLLASSGGLAMAILARRQEETG